MTTTNTPEYVAAWTLPETRRAWRRAALWGLAWLVAGIVLLAGFVTYSTWVVGRSDALKAHGTRVTATVLADQPGSLRCGQVGVPVQFTLDGVKRTETLSVDGCGGSSMSKNDHVTLYVDPAHPSSLVSDQSYNEGTSAVIAASVALILGLALPVCAVVRAVRLALTRAALRAGPWVERPARGVNVRGKTRDEIPVLALTDVEPAELLVLRWPASLDVSGTGPTVVIARSRHGWTVVAPHPGGPPRSARAPHDGLARKTMAVLDDYQAPQQ